MRISTSDSDRPDRSGTSHQVRRVIEGLFREGTAIARSDGSVHTLFPVAITAAEGDALRDLVVRERASQTIEIGLGYAISTLCICEALRASGDAGARHVVLDPYQATRYADCGLQFLDDARVADLVDFRAEESQIALPRFVTEERIFDLAFVDGNHGFDFVFLDLIYLGRLLRTGGVVMVDDYQLPAVARAVSFCTSNLGWALEDVSTADDMHQWAVVRTPHVPDTRPYDYYKEF